MVATSEELKYKLKKQIIEELNLEDITPEEIVNTEPLFGEGLGLDSIDALELVVILDAFYGIKITDAIVGRKVLYSIDTMAAFIMENKPG
jgi:Acyl carrier protein